MLNLFDMDKRAHALASYALALSLFDIGTNLWVSVIGTVWIGIAWEFWQRSTGNKFDVNDIMADAIGAALVIPFVFLV